MQISEPTRCSVLSRTRQCSNPRNSWIFTSKGSLSRQYLTSRRNFQVWNQTEQEGKKCEEGHTGPSNRGFSRKAMPCILSLIRPCPAPFPSYVLFTPAIEWWGLVSSAHNLLNFCDLMIRTQYKWVSRSHQSVPHFYLASLDFSSRTDTIFWGISNEKKAQVEMLCGSWGMSKIVTLGPRPQWELTCYLWGALAEPLAHKTQGHDKVAIHQWYLWGFITQQ